MNGKYLISIDQSTQGTKALLFDSSGNLIKRTDKAHEQIVNEKGWVSHDPSEIYENTLEVVRRLIEEAGIDKAFVAGVGICNQRETSLAWDRVTGEPLGLAIVWQCARAVDICERVEKTGQAEKIREKTGMNLSPYFPASKIAWILENVEGAKEKQMPDSFATEPLTVGLSISLQKGNPIKPIILMHPEHSFLIFLN